MRGVGFLIRWVTVCSKEGTCFMKLFHKRKSAPLVRGLHYMNLPCTQTLLSIREVATFAGSYIEIRIIVESEYSFGFIAFYIINKILPFLPALQIYVCLSLYGSTALVDLGRGSARADVEHVKILSSFCSVQKNIITARFVVLPFVRHLSLKLLKSPSTFCWLHTRMFCEVNNGRCRQRLLEVRPCLSVVVLILMFRFVCTHSSLLPNCRDCYHNLTLTLVFSTPICFLCVPLHKSLK
jgi:hypothetical protein